MSRACLAPLSTVTPLTFTPPPGACDSHAHIFGPYAKYPLAEDRSYTPPERPGQTFIDHLDELGLTRGVLVTASSSGTDNSIVIDALRQWPDRLRAVVVPAADTNTKTLDAWHAAGVRGVRVNLFQRDGHAVYRNGVGLDVLEPLAPALAERGMHAQIWIHAPDLVEMAPRLLKLGLPLVFDHMGRMDTGLGINNPGFQTLCRLIGEGKVWAKISGADRNTEMGPPYSDVDAFALALLNANDEQLVWGTDWPHINYFEQKHMPDDGVLSNLLARWMPTEAQRKRVLVDNAARLYDFPAKA